MENSDSSKNPAIGSDLKSNDITSYGISGFELDALKEVANIGSGNASMALSSIFKRKVNISIPKVQLVTMSEVSQNLKSQDGMVVGIFSRLKEGIDGNVFIFLPTVSALKFVSVLKNNDIGSKEVLTQEEEDLLKKISSVIYTAYITGLANFFEQKIIFSQPEVISTIGNTLLDSILIRIDKKENILIIDIDFSVEDVDIKGDFTLVLTMSSLSPLLQKLKQKMGM